MLHHLPLFGLVCALLLCAHAAAQTEAQAAPGISAQQTVRIGVMSFRGEKGGFTTHIAEEDAVLAKVPSWLQQHVPQVQFETRYYRMNALMEAVERKEVDLFLASSGLFWQMKRFGSRDLATIVSQKTPDPNEGVAGVIFVRKDRNELSNIEDLQGLTVSTGLPNMFLATQLAMAAVAEKAGDPEKFFSAVRRYDLPYPSVIDDVVRGYSDAGMLRACVLESEFPGWEHELKIIEPQDAEKFHCARSTPAYPNWTMAAVSGFDAELSRQIAVALLTMPHTGADAYRWTLATDFERVDRVAKLLKTDSYAYLKDWTLSRIWDEYHVLILSLAAVLAAFP